MKGYAQLVQKGVGVLVIGLDEDVLDFGYYYCIDGYLDFIGGFGAGLHC